MRNPFVQRAGGVLSADIAVPDHDHEIAFYSRILTTGDAPLWRDDLTNNLATPVIGLGKRTPEYNNLPLQWMPHFQVSDVSTSVAHAIDLGGQELVHSKTDDGQSQWAVLVDQGGAAFGVIPVVASGSDSASRDERRGCISWLSLATPDVLPARDFYQRVVGWIPRSVDAEDCEEDLGCFEMQIDDEIAAAEIRGRRSDVNSIPSVWLIHLPVDDLVESLRRVGEGGGEVIREYVEQEYAVIRDPVGVYLALRSG